MSSLAVELIGITRSFSGVVAVDDVTLDVVDGEFLSLLDHPAAARRQPSG